MQKYNLRTQTTPRKMSRLWFTSPLKFGSAATAMRLMGAFCSSYSPVSAVIYPQPDLSLTHFFLLSKCQWTTGGEYEIVLLPLTFAWQSTLKSIDLTLKDATTVLQLNQTFCNLTSNEMQAEHMGQYLDGDLLGQTSVTMCFLISQSQSLFADQVCVYKQLCS